ncbi:MAG: hypothetical protein K2P81_13050 [Bacteriovoracaceae bacterium]|nr:hypothetical protein [Bacteriovoracaceae bacterium]
MKKYLLITALLVPTLGFAKPSPYGQEVSKKAPYKAEENAYTWTTLSKVKEGKAKFSNQKRNPSNQNSGDESMMSDAFRKTRDQFLKLKSADEIEAFLNDLEQNYGSFKDEDQKFFVAHVLPLRELRGIAWRSAPVFSKAKITHSYVLTMLKNTQSSMKIFLPTEQWSAGFEYITTPYVREGKVAETFKNESDLVSHFSGPVRSSMLKAAKRIQAIDLNGKTIVWDNKLFFGKASFVDDVDRFRLVGEVERISSLASIHSSLAQISYQRAYSSENSMKLFQDMGKLYGVDGFLSEVDGAPSSKRTNVLRKSTYKNYGTLLPDGQEWMAQSFHHLQESVRLTAMVWDQIKREDRPLTEAFLFDTSFARAYERGSDLSIENMLAIVEGPAQIRSAITGEMVKVDLPAFYKNPPQDLKAFLPTAFVEGSEWKEMSLKDASGKVQTVKYRNYEIGRANNWDAQTYKQIFPDVKTGKDIPASVRVLSQSWGSWMSAMPLADIIE